MTQRFRSFAKINLGLEVVGRRGDGYHELRTLFATVSLHDIIEITPQRSGITVASDDPSLPTGDGNLAYRAVVAMQKAVGTFRGAHVFVRKRIPVGGGLGGGSSNAAAVLRALNLIWGCGFSTRDLTAPAGALGADVPYFLFGGPALGLGRGDAITPLDVTLDHKALLVPGGSPVSTAEVFREFARVRGNGGATSSIENFMKAASRGKPVARALSRLRNDLAEPAIAVSPGIAVVANGVAAAGRTSRARLAAMSGSGSTFFLLHDTIVARSNARRSLAGVGLRSIPCSLLSHAAYHRRFEIARDLR
jgi:4-diphosphocytidyl-2-C-methyl-D-erythritol kinase